MLTPLCNFDVVFIVCVCDEYSIIHKTKKVKWILEYVKKLFIGSIILVERVGKSD